MTRAYKLSLHTYEYVQVHMIKQVQYCDRRCDQFLGTCLVHSLAGGTGSGTRTCTCMSTVLRVSLGRSARSTSVSLEWTIRREGFGSRLAEALRDEYPQAYLHSVAVAPSRLTCDSPMQHYNAALCLAALDQ